MTESTNDKHQQRQQKVKEQVDARVAAAQREKGIFQVITGNGKGKSTSGFGVVARCVGPVSYTHLTLPTTPYV